MKHSLFVNRLALVVSCGLVFSGAWVSSTKAQTYSAPLVINDSNCPSDGCTFEGNWESTNPDVPAVSVQTSRAVVIQNSRVRSKGRLIQAPIRTDQTSHLTVRNTRGYGVDPGVFNRSTGRFVSVEGFRSLTIENCYLEGTSGIDVRRYEGDGTSNSTVRIRYNVARNIDGRRSDGNGGYKSGNVNEVDWDYAQFVQFNGVNGLPNAEISWNEIINLPFHSRVEDNINMYWSSGVGAHNPILIHNNYIQGAYPADPVNMGYSGGGILLSDGMSNYVSAYSNQVVSTSNYGLAIQGGHDNNFHDNRIVASGYLPDGRYISSMNVGAMIWNINNFGDFYNNSAWNNEIGWYRTTGYGEMWFPNAESEYGRNQGFSPVTAEDERDEWTYWKSKSGSSSVYPGPVAGEANSVTNPSFDAQRSNTQAPSGWRESGTVSASFTEIAGGTKSGARHATHRKSTAYSVYTFQTKTGLSNGLYTLRSWARSSGGQKECQLEAKDYGGAKRTAPLPVSGAYQLVEIRDIQVTNGQCTIGIWSDAGANNWAHFDDVEFLANNEFQSVGDEKSPGAQEHLTLSRHNCGNGRPEVQDIIPWHLLPLSSIEGFTQ